MKITRSIRLHHMLIVSSLFHAVNDATFAVLPAVLPFLVAEFALSYTHVGFLYGVALTVMVVFQYIAGDLADRYHEPDLLAVGCLIIFLSFVLMFYVNSYAEFLLLNIFYAIGFSIFHPVSYTVLSRVGYDEKDRTKAMGLSGSVGDLGNFVAFVSTGIIAERLGWRFPFIVWGISAWIAMGLYLTFLRGKARSLSIVVDHKPNRHRSEHGKRSALHWRFTALVFTICILMGALYRIFMNFTVLFLADVLYLTPAYADLIFSVFILVGVLGAFASGYISKHLGLTRSIAIEFLVAAVCALLLYLTQAFSLVLLLLIISGFALYTIYPTVYSLAADITSFRGIGRAYGLTISITFIGGTALSFIGGIVADLVGSISIVYLLGAIIALSAVVVVKYVPRAT